MSLIDTADDLAPEQVLISVCTATNPSELADAEWIVALGGRTEHDLLVVIPDVDRKGVFTGEFALVHVPHRDACRGFPHPGGRPPSRDHRLRPGLGLDHRRRRDPRRFQVHRRLTAVGHQPARAPR